MKIRAIFIPLTVVLCGVAILVRQRQEIAEIESELRNMAAVDTPSIHVPASQPVSNTSAPARAPSVELLRLRNEVTMLQRELGQGTPPPATGPAASADDWKSVYSGPRPSQLPGFVTFKDIHPSGFATPEAAFQTFQYKLHNQSMASPLAQAVLNDSIPSGQTNAPTDIFAEIWDLPDDYNDPAVRYSISIGHGIGDEIGYRIAKQEWASSNEVRLAIDLERPDGSSIRRQQTVVYRNNRWRLKPDKITRLPAE